MDTLRQGYGALESLRAAMQKGVGERYLRPYLCAITILTRSVLKGTASPCGGVRTQYPLFSCTHGITGTPIHFHRGFCLDLIYTHRISSVKFSVAQTQSCQTRRRYQKRPYPPKNKETIMSRLVPIQEMTMCRRSISHLSLGKRRRLKESALWMPTDSRGREKEEFQ